MFVPSPSVESLVGGHCEGKFTAGGQTIDSFTFFQLKFYK